MLRSVQVCAEFAKEIVVRCQVSGLIIPVGAGKNAANGRSASRCAIPKMSLKVVCQHQNAGSKMQPFFVLFLLMLPLHPTTQLLELLQIYGQRQQQCSVACNRKNVEKILQQT